MCTRIAPSVQDGDTGKDNGMDDATKRLTSDECGELALIRAQHPAPHLTHLPGSEDPSARPGTPTAPLRRPHRFPSLASAALGCVLALAALATPALAQAPAAVSDVVVVPVPRITTALTVSWSAPDNAGKPAITAYDVRYLQTDSFNSWTTVRQDAASTSVIIAGLASNRAYDVQVRAINADGSGPWSSTAKAFTTPEAERVYANHPLIPDGVGVPAIPSAFCTSLPIRRPPPARASRNTMTSLVTALFNSLNPAVS